MALIPNHDVYRPFVRGQPFTTKLVFDRASLGWQEVMEARFYLYPVHRSLTNLLCLSLASTLYLVLLRLMSREYASAFELLDSVAVDVAFTSEENWLFAQISRTLDDNHPDACACRLKLLLSVVYSSNKPKWDIHSQVDLYLSKLSRVSAACRLSPEEELLCIHQCKQVREEKRRERMRIKAYYGCS